MGSLQVMTFMRSWFESSFRGQFDTASDNSIYSALGTLPPQSKRRCSPVSCWTELSANENFLGCMTNGQHGPWWPVFDISCLERMNERLFKESDDNDISP